MEDNIEAFRQWLAIETTIIETNCELANIPNSIAIIAEIKHVMAKFNELFPPQNLNKMEDKLTAKERVELHLFNIANEEYPDEKEMVISEIACKNLIDLQHNESVQDCIDKLVWAKKQRLFNSQVYLAQQIQDDINSLETLLKPTV